MKWPSWITLSCPPKMKSTTTTFLMFSCARCSLCACNDGTTTRGASSVFGPPESKQWRAAFAFDATPRLAAAVLLRRHHIGTSAHRRRRRRRRWRPALHHDLHAKLVNYVVNDMRWSCARPTVLVRRASRIRTPAA